MEPEEMDVVELVMDIPVEPSWLVDAAKPVALLRAGQRGMVVHRQPQAPALYAVEFLDPTSSEPRVLATLRADQIRVVERDTLGDA